MKAEVTTALAVDEGMGSSSAKPTGTMSAAASAARIRTRYRFRIAGSASSSDVPTSAVQKTALFARQDFDDSYFGTGFPKVRMLGSNPSLEMPSSTVNQYPQLISLAVHEFRTPASVVGGYLRMLQRDPENPLTDRQRKMVEEAEKSCTRL